MIRTAILSIVFMSLGISTLAAIQFNHAFAPHDGLVAPVEQPLRSEVCLNGLWEFQPVALPADYKGVPTLAAPKADAWEKTRIKIPCPWNVNSYTSGNGGDFRCYPSYPKSWESASMGWLRRSFRVPADWKNRTIIVHFEAVAGDCEVIVNGKSVAHHFDTFMPFSVDITDVVKWDSDNELLVGVKKPELMCIEGRFGKYTYPTGSIWGMHAAGIWNDVFLQALPQTRVSDAYVKPLVDQDTLEVIVTLQNDGLKPRRITAEAKIYEWISIAGKDMISAPEAKWKLGKTAAMDMPASAVSVNPGEPVTTTLRQKVSGRLALWSPDSPKLYGIVIELKESGKPLDLRYIRFGWRQVGISGSSFTLNGKPLQLKGDAWHFMGIPQMTRRYAWGWFKMLKDANANAVRPHAQPYPPFYLDMADEMGIFVLDECAIYASHCANNYEEPVTWERNNTHVDALIVRDRNHPSVFGWSIGNEIRAAMWAKQTEKGVERQVEDHYRVIANRVKMLDPTRPWISSDGDEDFAGILPVWLNHYGDGSTFKDLAKKGKPYGVGECGCGYYGSPKQVSQFNGDRALECFEGRNEGVAIDAYEMLSAQRSSAAYCSVFNIAWYGLKPLAIGQKDTTRAPEVTDGIVFPEYVEGKPGVQPERLGPYCTTLNPGYDPNLPLYQPWPMFEAVRAAYAPGKPAPCKWDHRPAPGPARKTPVGTIDSVLFAGKTSSALLCSLDSIGTPIAPAADTGNSKLLIIDGLFLEAADVPTVRKQMDAVLANGGTAFIWGLEQDSLKNVNELLPAKIELSKVEDASLVLKDKSPVTSLLGLFDLYSAESPSNRLITKSAIGGPILRHAKVLLESCKTDWLKWNDVGEDVKTAAVLRSERETRPMGAAMVEIVSGRGRMIVTTLPQDANSPQLAGLDRKLMQGLGVKLKEPKMLEGSVFDMTGTLRKALVIASFGAETYEKAVSTDFLGGETSVAPKLGDRVGKATWQELEAGGNWIFEFGKMGVEPKVNCAAYMSFWLLSPRPLDQLLAQPNVPKVDFLAGSDDGLKVWLNGNVIIDDPSPHPLKADQFMASSLPLKQGWNHFMVKLIQSTGQWQFSGRLACSDIRFMASLQGSLSPPEK